jgi:hypothetical protein
MSLKKKAEVSKTEMEKRQPMDDGAVSSQKVEPSADDSQKDKQPDVATGASEKKTEPKPTDSAETKSVQSIETRSTDSVEIKPTEDKLSSQDLTVQTEMSTEASEKKPLPASDDAKTAKPSGSSDAAMEEQPSTLEDTGLKQNVSEIAPVTNNEEMVKTESRSANVEVSRPASIELSKPVPSLSLAIPTAPTAPEKEDVIVKKGTRKRSPSPSLIESDQPPPAKKQAIAPQQDVEVASPSPITASAGQPPSAKKPAIEPQKDVTIPSIVLTSTPTALLSTSTATTTAQASIPVTGTSTVTVTVLGSSMDIGSTQGATTGFDITPPPSSSSQLPSEVNADSLIQSLCSDSTNFEDPPDVSVLASQLGIDSVDSPVFNLSGFLSLLQPDLSVLTPEEQSTAIGGKLLGNDISSDEKQSSAITGPLLGDNSSDEKQSSAVGDQQLGEGSKNQKPPEETVGESAAKTTTTSFLATQTLPVAVSSVSSLQPEVAVPVPSALELPVVPSPPPLSSTSAPPASLLPAPVAEPTTATSMTILSPVMFPEEPIPPRPLVLGIPADAPNLGQTAPPPPLLGTPISPTPLTPTPLTPLGEGLLDLSDISSLMDESEVMEGISQDVFESIEKLVNLDEQSTNATWK